jgi:uncharacterized integral membrane protein
VLGLAFAALGLFFMVGDRTAAEIGWKWMWPVPLVVLGLLFVIAGSWRVARSPNSVRNASTRRPNRRTRTSARAS